MATINLTNSKGRDAAVEAESLRPPARVRWVDEKGRQAQRRKLLKATMDRDAEALAKAAGGPEKVAERLLAGDPEIDIETYGSFLEDAARVYVDADRNVVHKVIPWDVVYGPDGAEKERKPHVKALPNTNTETPLRWSGKLFKKSEVWNKFVFTLTRQIVHVNGLTYDFLFGMAKELEEKQSLLLLGGGPKGVQPLVFQRGGMAYRGFLEGRTQGDRYCLLLHLSNQELKAPPPAGAAPPKLDAKPEGGPS